MKTTALVGYRLTVLVCLGAIAFGVNRGRFYRGAMAVITDDVVTVEGTVKVDSPPAPAFEITPVRPGEYEGRAPQGPTEREFR